MRLRVLHLCIVLMFVPSANLAMAQAIPADSSKLQVIAWSPDGTRIAGTYTDSMIALWRVEDLSHPYLTFQAELADTIAWTPDSQYLILQGRHADGDGLLQMSVTKWDVTTGAQVDTLMSFELDTSFDFNPWYRVFPALALDSTRTEAAFSFRDGVIYISDGIQVLHLENDSATSHVYRMEWSPDGDRLAVVYGESDIYSIQLFDVESGKLIQTIYQDLQYYVTEMAWDSSGTYLATSSVRRTCCEGWSNVGAYNVSTDEPVRFRADRWWEEVRQSGIARIAWHPRRVALAIAGKDAVEIYDPFEEEALFLVAVDEARDVEWSPDGMQIATVSSDGSIAIWDVSL